MDGSKKFSTFDEVLLLYAEIFEKRPECIEEESIPILDYLKRINKKGIITISSQPGLDASYGLVCVKQRAFLDCFMKKDAFLNILSKNFIRDDVTCIVKSTKIELDPSYLDDSGDDGIIVRIESYKHGEYEPVSEITFKNYGPGIENLFEESVREEILASLVHVVFIDMQWGRINLFENFLAKC